MKLLSFGKKFENMFVTVDKSKLGSEFSTFSEKLKIGEVVIFVCASQMWGSARVCAEVVYEKNPIWKDKLYPYRAQIDEIKIFQAPISFVSCGVDKIFRDTLGKQWAYKVLFTPGELPLEAVKSIDSVLKNSKFLDQSEYEGFFSHHLGEFEKAKRKRLGLD
jgi:hypothetical protein